MSAARETPAPASPETRSPSAAGLAGGSPIAAQRDAQAARAPARASGPRWLAAELLRMLGGLALVVATTSALLRVLDAAPAWIAGEARGVRKVATVRDAEALLRARLLLPSYFPATFSWPPSRIRLLRGSPGAVALWVDGRGGGPGLLLAETVSPGPIPARLLPEAQTLDRSQVAVGASRGTLSRVIQEGLVCWELAWEQGGRSVLLRSRGSADELVRMARSAREAP